MLDRVELTASSSRAASPARPTVPASAPEEGRYPATLAPEEGRYPATLTSEEGRHPATLISTGGGEGTEGRYPAEGGSESDGGDGEASSCSSVALSSASEVTPNPPPDLHPNSNPDPAP